MLAHQVALAVGDGIEGRRREPARHRRDDGDCALGGQEIPQVIGILVLQLHLLRSIMRLGCLGLVTSSPP
jgi:hypothetical protein